MSTRSSPRPAIIVLALARPGALVAAPPLAARVTSAAVDAAAADRVGSWGHRDAWLSTVEDSHQVFFRSPAGGGNKGKITSPRSERCPVAEGSLACVSFFCPAANRPTLLRRWRV